MQLARKVGAAILGVVLGVDAAAAACTENSEAGAVEQLAKPIAATTRRCAPVSISR